MSKESAIAKAKMLDEVAHVEMNTREYRGIAPAWDYLVVKQPEHAERTQGGVILPATHGRDKNEAEVLAVGPGILHDGKTVPMPFKVGDRVVLANANYHPLFADGENVLLVKAGLVLAVVREGTLLLNAGGKRNYAAEYEAAHTED